MLKQVRVKIQTETDRTHMSQYTVNGHTVELRLDTEQLNCLISMIIFTQLLST